MEVIEYLDESGESPFGVWLAHLNDAQAQARIDARIGRLIGGLFGDCKPLAAGVWELRVDWGPGYRVDHARSGGQVILLLCGGDKRRRNTDIKRAIALGQDWQRRMEK